MKERLKRHGLGVVFTVSALSIAPATHSMVVQEANPLLAQAIQPKSTGLLGHYEISGKLYTPSLPAGVQSHHLAYEWHKNAAKQQQVSTHDSVGKGKKWLGKELTPQSTLALRLPSHRY